MLQVWLDVDELDDLAKLEEYVRGSVLVLAFISKGKPQPTPTPGPNPNPYPSPSHSPNP